MSGLYTDWGAVFVTEAVSQSSSVAGTFLSAIGPPPVLAGNIGGYSQFGKLNYGKASYSWSAIQPAFSATLSLVGVTTVNLAGNLAPTVSFGGVLNPLISVAGGIAPTVSFGGALTVGAPGVFVGDLAPRVTFGGNLSVTGILNLSGGIAPQVALGGSLAADLPFAGNMTTNVVLAATELLSGPLWAESAPCPPPMWAENEPCLDPGWVKIPTQPDQVYQGSAYGLGDYGARLYSQGRWVPAVWVPAESCHG